MAIAASVVAEQAFIVAAVRATAIAATAIAYNIIATAINLIAAIFAIRVRPYLERYTKRLAALLTLLLCLQHRHLELKLRVAKKCQPLMLLIYLFVAIWLIQLELLTNLEFLQQQLEVVV